MSEPTEILVVDDDADLRACLRMLLELEGYRVREAGDGRSALDAIHARMPGLILLDLTMPLMDGASFLAELRRTGVNGSAPVTVLSSMVGTDGYEDLQERYACSTLRKPVSAVALMDHVRCSLDHRPAPC